MRRYPLTTVAVLGLGMIGWFLADELRRGSAAGEQPAKVAKAAQLYVRLLGTSA